MINIFIYGADIIIKHRSVGFIPNMELDKIK